jgi:hypothetical protein
MRKLKFLSLAAALSSVWLSTLAGESTKIKQIFESKTLSIWYHAYPNTHYPDEFGTYKYFWIGYQARGKHSDSECVVGEAQIITDLNFSFEDLNKTFTFERDCPSVAVTGDTGFELKRYFSDNELEKIRRQPQLLKLTVIKSKIMRKDSYKSR